MESGAYTGSIGFMRVEPPSAVDPAKVRQLRALFEFHDIKEDEVVAELRRCHPDEERLGRLRHDHDQLEWFLLQLMAQCTPEEIETAHAGDV